MLKLNELTNKNILDSEGDFEFEGLCGTEDGVLIEESLEQFFRKNKIELISEDKENSILTYKQGEIERDVKVLYSLKGLEYLDFGK